MKKTWIGAIVALLATAGSVEAQMWFFPDYALPSSNGNPATWFAATYARGLNDATGETNSFGGAVGRTTERASFMGAIGQARASGDSELTFGGAAGFDVMQGERSILTLQGGVGFVESGSLTLLRFPIGLAIKGTWQSDEAAITPWIMPRANISRLSSDVTSVTETDFGASTGVSFTTPGGFGVHTALDVLFGDGDQLWYFGIGGHYVLGMGGS